MGTRAERFCAPSRGYVGAEAGTSRCVVRLDDRTSNRRKTGRSLRGRPARLVDLTGIRAHLDFVCWNECRLATSATCRLRSFQSVLWDVRCVRLRVTSICASASATRTEPAALGTGNVCRPARPGEVTSKRPSTGGGTGKICGDRAYSPADTAPHTTTSTKESLPARQDGSTSLKRLDVRRPTRPGRRATEARGCEAEFGWGSSDC